ncbi:MAG: AAA family ATPase [Candidatus Krumholzibacteria bacterium]|jgi:MoxR-like ATPase|nr:AAA family ATPase [Candidatus Krumholzibacteria bacterium]MDP6668458.1 AAA family ATPase [Candidatus Krumholzibacteria bacterium]MDP6798076.1 AAA family ATPase [Candidatus Krumholzibacteria bacterium]MDP7021551.1 AAA family ATPase [Candidatus Krumholzibacteria bacterium]
METHYNVDELNERVERESHFVREIREEVSRVIVGQQYLVDRLLIGLLCRGHVLLEGLPGLAKTLAVSSLAGAVKADYRRIQFTPDLLPADLLGTQIYDPKTGDFRTRKGPVFANFILADEINRAPAKVQSALLEAMQEHQVTLGGETHALPEPFLVLATQNPIEQEGTYPLPEAQVDRFMLKVRVGYPDRAEEKEILQRMGGMESPRVNAVIETARIEEARKLIHEIYMDEKVLDYIIALVFATREPESVGLGQLISYGASPRATIYLAQAARAHAFLRGRGYVTPEDVKKVGLDVLRHRIIVSYEAEAEELDSDAVVLRLFDAVELP